MKVKIPLVIAKILNKFAENNASAYVVGGCVRDSLLNQTPKDWDITTNLKPDEVRELFSSYKTIDANGEAHGTVILIFEGEQVEITTFRADKSCDGRHAVVEYVTNINDDLLRRDFTINAMAYSPETGLIDIVNGIEDLNSRVIRSVGNPYDRFHEDYLRILRALRFSSRLDFDISASDKIAMLELKDSLNLISKERILKELSGILVGKNVFKILDEYKEIFGVIISELKDGFFFDQKSKYHNHDVYTHLISVVANTKPDFATRMAALLHDIGKPTCYTEEIKDSLVIRHFQKHAIRSFDLSLQILTRLKCPRNLKEEILFLVLYHDSRLDSRLAIKRLISKIPNNSIELFEKLLDLMAADKKDHTIISDKLSIEEIRNIGLEIFNSGSCLKLTDLSIDGYDLLKLGVKGKDIGAILNELLADVIDDKIINEHSILMEEVKKIIKRDA